MAKKPKKRLYTVQIPIVGTMTASIAADSESAAIAAAWALYNESGPDVFDVEWEAIPKVTEGNVCNAPLNERMRRA